MRLSRAGSILVIVLRILWTLFALFIWLGGLAVFCDDTRFGMWFAWGAMCAIPICATVIRNAIGTARDGAERGSREYTVSYSEYSNTYSIRDNSGSGCLWGFIGGLLGGVLIGPVILPVYIVTTVITVIGDIRFFAGGLDS